MSYVLTSVCEGENSTPQIFSTKDIAINQMVIRAAQIVKSRMQNEWVQEPLPTTDNELEEARLIFDYAEKAGKVTWKSDSEIEVFPNSEGGTRFRIFEVNGRLENLLIYAFEWAINVGEQATHDIIRATGILPEELDAIGYDAENFPKMHEWAA